MTRPVYPADAACAFGVSLPTETIARCGRNVGSGSTGQSRSGPRRGRSPPTEPCRTCTRCPVPPALPATDVELAFDTGQDGPASAKTHRCPAARWDQSSRGQADYAAHPERIRCVSSNSGVPNLDWNDRDDSTCTLAVKTVHRPWYNGKQYGDSSVELVRRPCRGIGLLLGPPYASFIMAT